VILGPEWEHEPFFITGIDLRGRSTASEELMRLLALTIATASVLAFAFPQTPRVLAQGSDSGAVGRPLQLDGGPSLGSDNRGQSSGGGSERTEPSAGVRSEKSQTQIGKTSETTVRGRSRSRIGLSSRPRHRLVIYRRGHHVVAFNGPRHGFAIHRHGHHLVAFSGPRHRLVIHRHGRRYVAFNDPSAHVMISRMQASMATREK
jgi:hypothetical protein